RRKLMQQPDWQQEHDMAAAVAKDHFGHPRNYDVGYIFPDRRTCCNAGVHRHSQAGIVGTPEKGAFSIVVSDKYEDDQDLGYTIIYTGAGKSPSAPIPGGRDEVTGRQVEDQDMERRENAALKTSHEKGRPIRVIRSLKYGRGYRYDGLYRVMEAKEVKGKSGYKICQFVLIREGNQPPLPT
ncbi:PUA-like domain-containing protein, partial [Schizophyllum commune]